MESEGKKESGKTLQEIRDRLMAENVAEPHEKKLEGYTFGTQFNYRKIRDKTLPIACYQIHPMTHIY